MGQESRHAPAPRKQVSISKASQLGTGIDKDVRASEGRNGCLPGPPSRPMWNGVEIKIARTKRCPLGYVQHRKPESQGQGEPGWRDSTHPKVGELSGRVRATTAGPGLRLGRGKDIASGSPAGESGIGAAVTAPPAHRLRA
jgi:hypothetical protein